MSSLFPVSAAWPDRGLCLVWRGDSILSCSSCLIQPGSSSQLLVLPPTLYLHFLQSHNQETWGTAQLATDQLCDLEQVA